jgi:beta-N-acetylhexosaminidase
MPTARKPAGSRRSRRRPPPTVYRRRRAVALGALLALTVGVVLAVRALSGGSSGSGEIDVSSVPTERLIGQRLMVRMGGTATPPLLRAARRGEIGGVILFPPPGQDVKLLADQIDRLQGAARQGGNPPLLASIDQEGGPIKRLPGGPPKSSPAQLGQSGDKGSAETAGKQTGRYLARLGFNVDLAPVLDVPQSGNSFIASRTFGTDPKQVAALGAAFAGGLQSGGVAATAKHFPGLGAATANTDLGSSLINLRTKDLKDDLVPFRSAIEAGVDLVMISNATYTAYGRDAGQSPNPPASSLVNSPAAFSPAIVGDLLRGELGFDGVVISDDLEAAAVSESRTPPDAAVGAARAGVDVLLFAHTDPSSRVTTELRKAALTRPQLEDSYRRIVSLKESLAG